MTSKPDPELQVTLSWGVATITIEKIIPDLDSVSKFKRKGYEADFKSAIAKLKNALKNAMLNAEVQLAMDAYVTDLVRVHSTNDVGMFVPVAVQKMADYEKSVKVVVEVFKGRPENMDRGTCGIFIPKSQLVQIGRKSYAAAWVVNKNLAVATERASTMERHLRYERTCATQAVWLDKEDVIGPVLAAILKQMPVDLEGTIARRKAEGEAAWEAGRVQREEVSRAEAEALKARFAEHTAGLARDAKRKADRIAAMEVVAQGVTVRWHEWDDSFQKSVEMVTHGATVKRSKSLAYIVKKNGVVVCKKLDYIHIDPATEPTGE